MCKYNVCYDLTFLVSYTPNLYAGCDKNLNEVLFPVSKRNKQNKII